MQCDYGVIRGNSGQAVLHLTAPRGAKRSLRFSSSGVSAADPATRIQATHLEDNWIIVLDGTERYVVPDAAIDGG
jgi:hypothetical protein